MLGLVAPVLAVLHLALHLLGIAAMIPDRLRVIPNVPGSILLPLPPL